MVGLFWLDDITSKFSILSEKWFIFTKNQWLDKGLTLSDLFFGGGSFRISTGSSVRSSDISTSESSDSIFGFLPTFSDLTSVDLQWLPFFLFFEPTGYILFDLGPGFGPKLGRSSVFFRSEFCDPSKYRR